jgi:hypothetical protein
VPRVGGFVLVWLLGFLCVACPAVAARKPGCYAGEPLRTSPLARVFSHPDDVFYVCWKRTRRVTFLGAAMGSHDGIDQLALAGRYVAVEHFDQDVTGDQAFDITVKDAATGRDFATIDGRDGVTRRILLTRSGYLAWTREDRHDVHVEVLARGTLHVLDSGPAIQPFSLALGGGYLYWMNGDQARSAAPP